MESPVFLPLAAAAAPFLPMFVPASLANRHATLLGRAVTWLLTGTLFLALAAGGFLLAAGGPLHHTFLAAGPAGLTVYFDTVSAVMLLLISFLGASVAGFARNYLAGDPGQGRFFQWLSVTVGCALVLVIAGNLALFAVAWVASSIALHRLLTFYGERPAARAAAWKKMVVSRLGDLCILGALGVAWTAFGTLDYARIFAAAEAAPSPGFSALAFLLVAGAMVKSAQFPFHTWLPDTMETPTPVSALMHAGIINAGGFLIIRFSPLVSQTPAALDLLAVGGAVTALFGSLVMISQTSIKRSLAFSTIAQMGFMMLQCGLGAFALALLHIVAHSLYKAHAFLSSGGVIARIRSRGAPVDRRHPGLAGVLLAFSVAAGLAAGAAALVGSAPWKSPAALALALILTIALAQLLWNWWAVTLTATGFLSGVAVAAGMGTLSFLLHAGAGALVGPVVAAPPSSGTLWVLAAVVPAAFLLVAARMFLPPGWASTSWGRALYVHAHNGWYLGAWVHRLFARKTTSHAA